MTYDYQIWHGDTFGGVNSNVANQADAGDVITSRSRDKLKPLYLHYYSAYGHHSWQDDD